MRLPKREPGARGRSFIHPRPYRESVSIKARAASLQQKDGKLISIRHQSGGSRLKARFYSREVYILNPLTNKRQQLTLLIREDQDGTLKYSFCYCPGASLRMLAYRQCKQHFIEKAFREAKKELGLNEYQTRSEKSYHKHMAMVMLGQLFINEEKLYHYEQSTIWMTTQEVIHSIKSVIGFVKRTLEELFNHIIRKQPPDKRLTKKLIYVRI
jgi:hypothetical protein